MGKVPTTLLPRRTASLLPSSTLTRPTTGCSSSSCSSSSPTPLAIQSSQVRHATLIPRPRRPYQFTQLVQLSDGSTYTVRTTSPVALYRSTKDSRNHILWQPSEKSLRNVEVDEAGKLAAFRERFGRSWDMGAAAAEADEGAAEAEDQQQQQQAKGGKQRPVAAAEPAPEEEDLGDTLGDLISGYAAKNPTKLGGGLSAKAQAKRDKGKQKK